MVGHVAGHAAIDADVFARDEARLVGGQVEHHVGDVHWIADTSSNVLGGIGTIGGLARRIYPARRNRIDADASGKTGGKRMGERGDTPLRRRVAFLLWLAHPIARRRDVDDGRSLGEMVLE